MRSICFLIVISSLSVFSFAQSRSVTAEVYDKAFEHAVSETNECFPFVHTFTSEIFENDKLVSTSVHVAERQGAGIERQTFTTIENGKTTLSYQLRTGYGNNVYCSSDGSSWTGPQLYECPRSIRVYRPRSPTSVRYSVEEKIVAGKKVKAYYKLEVFEVSGKNPSFAEELALIGADGLFLSITKTMGDLKTKQVTTKLTNAWKLNAKFTPVTAPRNVTPAAKSPSEGSTITIRKN